MKNKNKILILIITYMVLAVNNLPGRQTAIGIQFTGISIHPGGAAHSDIMPLKIDEAGLFVINPGLRLNFEYFFFRDIFSIKFAQGFYGDCTMSFGGFSHIGIRGRIFQRGNHTIRGGIGPTYLFRRNWYRLDGYLGNDNFFRGTPDNTWQWRFLWYGGELEYYYKISERTELMVSMVPFYPVIIQFGVRIFINR